MSKRTVAVAGRCHHSSRCFESAVADDVAMDVVAVDGQASNRSGCVWGW